MKRKTIGVLVGGITDDFTRLQTQKKNRGQMVLLREGFSVDIAENALEGAGAEAMRNINIWFINVLLFPLQIIRNVSGR